MNTLRELFLCFVGSAMVIGMLYIVCFYGPVVVRALVSVLNKIIRYCIGMVCTMIWALLVCPVMYTRGFIYGSKALKQPAKDVQTAHRRAFRAEQRIIKQLPDVWNKRLDQAFALANRKHREADLKLFSLAFSPDIIKNVNARREKTRTYRHLQRLTKLRKQKKIPCRES